MDGAPYTRIVTVSSPADWAANNNALLNPFNINVEVPGRRFQSTDIIDLRLEKKFEVGKFGKIGVFLDIFNLLGNRYVLSGVNPGGIWRPIGDNTNVGTYSPEPWYGRITGTEGSRIYKFSLRYTF